MRRGPEPGPAPGPGPVHRGGPAGAAPVGRDPAVPWESSGPCSPRWPTRPGSPHRPGALERAHLALGDWRDAWCWLAGSQELDARGHGGLGRPGRYNYDHGDRHWGRGDPGRDLRPGLVDHPRSLARHAGPRPARDARRAVRQVTRLSLGAAWPAVAAGRAAAATVNTLVMAPVHSLMIPATTTPPAARPGRPARQPAAPSCRCYLAVMDLRDRGLGARSSAGGRTNQCHLKRSGHQLAAAGRGGHRPGRGEPGRTPGNPPRA